MTHFRGISFTLTRIFDSLTEFMTQISFILIYLLAIGALRSVDYGHIVTCDIRGCKNYIGRQLARTKRDLIGLGLKYYSLKNQKVRIWKTFYGHVVRNEK